ncbi:MAG: heavy metal translocating P-type ATPase [Gammaproteobacteria bacterium]
MQSEGSSGAGGCFHCGLPLDPSYTGDLLILGQVREFCCPGCRAVAEAITDAGMEEFYSHRRARPVTGGTVGAEELPAVISRLAFYDHPQVQNSFARSADKTDKNATGGGAREAHLLLENIRCAACVWLNEQVVRGLEGVLDVEMDYASHHARVVWDPDRIRLSEILQAIINVGYVAHPFDPARREALNAVQRRRSGERLLFAGVIGMVVMQFALAGYVMGLGDETGELSLWTLIGRWTSLFATTVLLAWPGQEFFIGAWRDLRNRRAGMDVPIVLGLSIAYLGSLHTTIFRVGEVYFDSIAMFVFLVLLARRIELKGRIQATDALDRVARITPRTARKLEGADTCDVLVTELLPGDRVRILPGETVPVDVRITDGHSHFDEALLTGEPLPVARGPGEEVVGGATNVDQPVIAEVARVAGESAVARIQGLLARGQGTGPRYAVLAQSASAWFVAAVLVIAVCTALAWWFIDPGSVLPNTVAVLIVTCPCAFALAAPVAAAVSAGHLANIGVLQAQGNVLERLAQCDTAVFDKTGTLTTGRLELREVHVSDGISETEARRIAASLEAASEHPVAKALVRASDGLEPLEDFRNLPGRGVEGRYAGQLWRLGNREFAAGVTGNGASAFFQQWVEACESEGLIAVVLAGESGHWAVFGLSDSRREGLDDLIPGLRSLGIERIEVLSGDSQDSVDRFVRGLGVDTALGDRMPEGKLAHIESLQAQGRRVVMIGDGINDAPVLRAAEVSVSFTHASALAQTHSGILLLGQSLHGVVDTRAVADKTRRIIRQNLAWAAFYNFAAVPAAALGWVPPWGAAIGMSLSSLLVVLNALRLRGRSGSATT